MLKVLQQNVYRIISNLEGKLCLIVHIKDLRKSYRFQVWLNICILLIFTMKRIYSPIIKLDCL
jgi:hypothetical protein